MLSRNRKLTDQELAYEVFESALVAKSQFENETGTENEAKDQIPIPNTYQEAIQYPIYSCKWKEAIKTEIDGINSFNTWKLVKWTSGQMLISNK